MAGPGGILALLASKPKGKGGSEKSGPPESEASGMSRHAEIMKNMWANMKAGDWDSAAMDFHDAYMECKGTEDAEDDSDAEDDYAEE